MADLYIGLMSGTSLDGVDGALMDFHDGDHSLLAHACLPFPDALRAEFLALNGVGSNELDRAARAANSLARLYAQVVDALLARGRVAAKSIRAIGAHGQTVRHCPPDGANAGPDGYSVQLNNPALLAELTCIDVVADFRSRDVAAGGQGAPLVPPFHRAVFGRPGQSLLVLNLGGISNLSVAGPSPQDALLGFDCGPGNALLDLWCQLHRGAPYDADGAWGASGRVDATLLHQLLQEPYFARPAPKSTGRDLFHAAWLDQALQASAALAPADVQATLTELTARVCADGARRYSGATGGELIVCGGGALNGYLMGRLQALLPGLRVVSSQAHGLHPLHVECAAFAWLASRTLARQTGSDPKVTGAKGAPVLGAIYPA